MDPLARMEYFVYGGGVESIKLMPEKSLEALFFKLIARGIRDSEHNSLNRL